MLIDNTSKRACIYFIYDKDGIVDKYVLNQLQDMSKNVVFLHCVVNGKLQPQSKSAVEQIVDEVFERENEGNDIGAYKAAINHIGWEKLSQFDEVVLMNNTCFGPVYPFEEVFEWAQNKDIEFWGLTSDVKSPWLGKEKYLHYNPARTHFQSYFLAIRKPLWGSKLLKDFFEEIPKDVDYIHSGCLYEYAFPGYFEQYGYTGAVYCDTTDENYPLLHSPVSLLRDYRMPLIKKRSFFHHYTDVLNNTAGEATAALLEFLQTETDYDTNLIWDSVLRTASLSDIVRCAQLNRILPDDSVAHPSTQQTKLGVVYHAYFQDLFDDSLHYLQNFPQGTDFLFTTDSEEKKLVLCEKLRKAGIDGEVKVIPNRGRDVSALLVAGKDFVFNHDLVCFAHDKKSRQVTPPSLGRSWFQKLNRCMFGSKEYVLNVISLFEREQRLGIAFPPYPNHGNYARDIGTGWTGNFANTKKLLGEFGVNVKMHEHTLCVAPLGTCFWFRPQALKKFFDKYDGNGWQYSDFPREPNRSDQTILHAIERCYAYMAQDAGYYPVFLYNSKFAEIEFTNLEFNKCGSEEMRAWVEALAMAPLGFKDLNNVTKEQIMQKYDQTYNYGIRRSLAHLGYAIKCRFPHLWKFLWPMRKICRILFRIK